MRTSFEFEAARQFGPATPTEGLEAMVMNPARPASPNYYGALCLLEWLESVRVEGADWWVSQLDRARTLLESAWYEEGGSGPAISAYIQAEMGGLEWLAGNLDQAENLLAAAKESFTTVELGEKAVRMEDALAGIAALRR